MESKKQGRMQIIGNRTAPSERGQRVYKTRSSKNEDNGKCLQKESIMQEVVSYRKNCKFCLARMVDEREEEEEGE
jgi:hypothetical protein